MVITVTCPSCSASFPVDPAKIPVGGVNARCSSCGDVFRVEKPADEPVAALEELAPAASPAPAPPAAAPPAPEASPEPPAAEAPSAPAAPTAPPPLPEPSVADAPAPDAVESAPEPDPVESAPAAEESVQDWTIENEELPAIDPDPLPPPVMPEVEPVAPPPEASPAGDPFAEAAPFETAPPPPAPAVESPMVPEAPAEPAAPEPPAEEPAKPAVQGFTFGKRDPTDKAKRLARVLVSDMIMYNAERHQSALSAGTLQQDFEDEIEKSWKEYVDQVGEDLANAEGRAFWKEALNDILAKGQQIF